MATSENNPGEFREFALALADEARRFLRGRFRAGNALELKGDRTPVTEADRGLEERLRERIHARYPGHGILGEEYGADGVDREHVWVLDPIDGTKAFVGGKPLFVSLIGLARAGRPFLGVIEAPATEERWLGVDGEGTRGNGELVRVAPRPPDERAIVATGGPFVYSPEIRAGLERIHARVGWLMYELDGYAYGLLARGDVHAVLESQLGIHDCCALDPVVRNAGGVIRGWDGRPVTIETQGELLAACEPGLAAELMKLAGETS